jgi:hypothetical protein
MKLRWRHGGLLLCTLFSFPALAVEQQEKPTAVDIIMGQYYDQFKDLPPGRKCTPDDAKGAWKETGIFEAATGKENADQKARGPKYMGFGTYNTFALWRSLIAVDSASVIAATQTEGLQYIMTSAGMLYVYRDGTLLTSQLCFVSTSPTDKFAIGTLMLALPVEKDKSLTINLFTPLQ